jgi:hypothetical protein
MHLEHRRWVADLAQKDPANFLQKEAAALDWTILGLFTGSRGSECIQAIATLHGFAKVPRIAAAGEFIGTPLAFMASNFACFDSRSRLVPHQQALSNPSRLDEFHVRFWCNKSPNNFTVRKFQHSGHAFICAVLRSLLILRSFHLLRPSCLEPLGVVKWDRPARSSWACPRTCLRSADVR